MTRGLLLSAAMVLTVACAARANAQEDRGPWRSVSTSARNITGDIVIGEAKVTINFFTFPLAQIRRLKPVEVSAVFDADVNAGIEGTLYRLRVPPGQYISKKNTLCGGEETQWMATYVTGHTLKVAFYSGDDMPVFTFDAMQNTATLCGTYTYAR
jgi:phospholipase C